MNTTSFETSSGLSLKNINKSLNVWFDLIYFAIRDNFINLVTRTSVSRESTGFSFRCWLVVHSLIIIHHILPIYLLKYNRWK